MRIACLARRLATDSRGATAIEYGLILALVALAMLGGLQVLGNGTSGSWGHTSGEVTTAMNR